MDSIQKTQRKISKVSIRYGRPIRWKLAFSDTLQIVRKFSATIKFFEVEEVSIEMSDFLEIIALTPNAEHIHLDNVFVYNTQVRTKWQLNNECLKLDRLKTLELVECSKEFLVLFDRLPAGVLNEFTMAYWNIHFDVLTDFFTKQSNIKKLALLNADKHDNSTLPDNIFDHLKLESLSCYQKEYNSTYANILCKQTQLSSLSLRNRSGHSDAKIDESVLIVITNQLSEMETLEVSVKEALDVQFKGIAKLKKLKDLTLDCCTLKIIETFSGLDNSRITSLNLKNSYTFVNFVNFFVDVPPMPINIIASLASSVPNLKMLRFDYNCDLPSIVTIMQHFNFVEVLEMKIHTDFDANYLSQIIKVDRCFNPKLTKLKITAEFLCEESILTKLIAIYPNLKKLNIRSRIPPSTSQFKLILSEFNKMVSLKLHVRSWNLTAEYVDCIKNHKNNLKSIWLSQIGLDELSAEDKKKLGTVFDVIRYEHHSLYMTN